MSIHSVDIADWQGTILENINLVDLITNEYELMTFSQPGFLRTTDRPHIYRHNEEPVINMDHVEIVKHDDEGVVWNFDTSEIGIGIEAGTIKTGSRQCPFKDKYKIRHEFVAEALDRSSTDKKLKEVFEEEEDDDDDATPDFAWKDHNGFYHVVEVTTTRANNEEGLQRAYDIKMFKYRHALDVRALKNIVCTYTVIVVSHDFVMTSIKMPRYLVSELIIRIRIGLALENMAISQGIRFEVDETEEFYSVYMQEIKDHLEKIKFVQTKVHPLTITREYIESIKEQPSEKKVFQVFLNEINQKKLDCLSEENKNIIQDYDDHMLTFIKNCNEGDKRMDMKSVINLPLIIPTPTKSDINIPDMMLESYGKLEEKMWSLAMDSFRTNRTTVEESPAKLLAEAFETSPQLIKQYQDERKSQRSQCKRVEIIPKLDSVEQEMAGEQGLCAKRYKDEKFYKNRRKQTQKAFKWSTPTEDIDEFLMNDKLLQESSYEPNDSIKMTLELMKESNNMIGNSAKGMEIIKLWSNTKLFRALDFISDLAIELCISIKQNCKTGHALLKKLRYHNCYVLIFPTKSSEHLFFTLYIPEGEILSQSPFRKCFKYKHGYITELVSVKESKLENWCNASASLISLVAFWSWFYEMDNDYISSFLLNGEAHKMLMLSLLIRLEDKAQTEETITVCRYMYMECFKGLITPINSRPQKLFKKLNANPRSRLNLWFLKKLSYNFKKMVKTPPERITMQAEELVEGEDALPRDTWINLLNCFTGAPIQSSSKVINLVYLGYLKNKNESPEGNTDFSLIEKTLEEEFSLDLTNISYSKGDTPDDVRPSGKQFNKNCIMYGSYLMEKKFEKQLGVKWKDLLEKEMLYNLSNSMTEEIASLKASSSIDHKNAPKLVNLLDPKAALRVKVIEAIAKNISTYGLNAYCKLDLIMNYVETTSRGIIADLFKKQQHGGLREIYVLTIESRFLQLFIEVIARTLCSYFEEETLTHPKNKLRKLNDHRKLSARLSHRRNSLVVDLCSSNDKTRWNQNFVMHAMIIPLIRLTPEIFHNSIIRILNLWTSKLIKIPQSVCLHLLNRTKFTSPIFNTLLEEFWNPSNKGIFDSKSLDCVRLKTGMMQGILHYTSSLEHLAFVFATTRIINVILSQTYPDYQFLITKICSSDDSAVMLSVLSPENTPALNYDFIKVSCHASICLEALTTICQYFCMKESEKSAVSLIDVVEFNSEFMFNNTIAMPVIKFVAASLNLTESESFIDRFYTQYNLISDLFGSGFTAEHTHLCQLSQAFFHYKTMGSSTNALFSNWKDLIINWPDPKYGFFLIDCDLMPGVLGYSFAHWNACITTPIYRGTTKEFDREPWVSTPEGGITQTLIIKHGDVIRWKKLVKNIVGDMDIQALIEKTPSILFRHANTPEELKLKLAIRATSPGVAKSMRRGNPFIQALAMSVYAINTHCFSKTTVTYDFGAKNKTTEKVCILGELERLKNSVAIAENIHLSLELAFPNHKKFSEAKRIIRIMRGAMPVRCHRFRERKNEIVIQPRTVLAPVSLLNVLKNEWYGMTAFASKKIVARCFAMYQAIIPWLRKRPDLSLAESPFHTYQEMYNFISSTAARTRVFRRNGPGIYSKRFTGQIYNLIRKSQRPCIILMESRERKITIPSTDMISRINLALSIPYRKEREHMIRRILKQEPQLYDDLNSISSMTRRDATISYIQGILKNHFSIEDVALHMRDLGIGTHLSFVQEQRKIESDKGVKWLGEGKCYVFTEGCQIQLTINDSFVTIIKVDNWKRLKQNSQSLANLLRDMKLKPLCTSATMLQEVAKFNGSHVVSSMSVGTPIKILKDNEKVIFDPASLVLRIDHNEIKIIQKIKSRITNETLYEVCMLKYKMSHNDIMITQKISSQYKGEELLWEAWVYQKPLKPDILFSYIKMVNERKADPLYAWLQETLQCRLKFKNLGSFNIKMYDTALDVVEAQQASLEELQEEEDILTMIREGKIFEEGGISEQLLTLPKPSTKDPESWAKQIMEEEREIEMTAMAQLLSIGVAEPLPLWVEHVKNWMEYVGEASVSVIGPAYGSFLCVHPLWDLVIDGMVEERATFWFEITEGSVIRGQEELCLAYMDLLGIRPKIERAPIVSMADRFKLAKEIRESPKYSKKREDLDLEEGQEQLEEDIDIDLPEEPDSEYSDSDPLVRSSAEDEDEDIFVIFD